METQKSIVPYILQFSNVIYSEYSWLYEKALIFKKDYQNSLIYNNFAIIDSIKNVFQVLLLLLIFYVLYKIIIGKKRRVAKRIH